MNAPPLGLFLTSLAADGIQVTLRDCDRIALVLGTGSPWTLTRLRDTLLALLAKDDEQQELLLHRFADFFETDLEIDPRLAEVNVAQVLDDLRRVVPHEPTAPASSDAEPAVPLPPVSPQVQEPSRPSHPWALLTALLAILVVSLGLAYIFRPQPAPPPTPLPKPTIGIGAPPAAATPDPNRGRQRTYEDVPVILTVTPETVMVEPVDWMPYLLASIMLFTAALGYFVYVQRSRRIPEDQPQPYDENGPRYFPLGAIGGSPTPLFSESEFDELADSMGYFLSEESSSKLDVVTSIQLTMRHGGVPALEYFRRHSVRSLLILEDAFAEPAAWNPVAGQLADGMARRGIEVVHARFFGSPGQYRLPDGPVVRLEDIEDRRNGHVVLIFSDGCGLARQESTFALETLGRWPMVAWLDLREPRFWDETAALPARYGIPVFPATPDGVLDAIRRFLTEQGTVVDYAERARPGQGVPSADKIQFDVYVEELLGDAFPWAQTCALFQPVSPGLADSLRREFYPDLPAERIGRLYALPDTRQTVAGLRFSDNVCRVLRTAFFARRDDLEQEKVLRFLQAEIERVEPADPLSIAHLAWEAARERVRLELDQDAALQRLAQLAKTPVGDAISDSLYGFGFQDGQLDRIPLRLKPDNKDAWQRLARITDNFDIPRLKQYPVSRLQWAGLATLILLCFVTAGIGIWQVLHPPELPKNWALVGEGFEDAYGVYASLEEQTDAGWVPALSESASGPFRDWTTRLPFQPDHRYRLAVYEIGHRNVLSFTAAAGAKLNVQLGRVDTPYNCVEPYPNIGLTIYRCSDSEGDIRVNEPFTPRFWRNTHRLNTSDSRVASIGIEFDQGEPENRIARILRNVLLETRAVDVVFRIEVTPSIPGESKPALQFVGQLLGPLADRSQLLVWYPEERPGLPALSNLFAGRIFSLRANPGFLREDLEHLQADARVWLPTDRIVEALQGAYPPATGATPSAFTAPVTTTTVAARPEVTPSATSAQVEEGSAMLPGSQFAKIWFGLTATLPGRVTVTATWDRSNPEASGVGFYVLDEQDLTAVINGNSLRDNNLTMGDVKFFANGPDNAQGAAFDATGANYTIVLYNDSNADANVCLEVQNGRLSDDSGQLELGCGARVAAPEATATTAAATVTGFPLRAREVKGTLPEQYDQHYLGLEPSERDAEIQLTLTFDPQDSQELARRLNFWVLDDQGFRRYLEGENPVDLAVAAGIPSSDTNNVRTASFRSSGFGTYTVIIYNNSRVPAEYQLRVDGGVLGDDSGQTLPTSAVATTDANRRSGPGMDYPIVGGVPAGYALTITGRNEDSTWYLLADGSWILGELVAYPPVDAPVVETPTETDPVGCIDVIRNGSFETLFDAWALSSGPRAPHYVSPPRPVFAGSRSMQTGIVDLPNIFSDSFVFQDVTLPSGPQVITVSFHYYPQFTSAPGATSIQYARVEQPAGGLLASLLNLQSNTRTWTPVVQDISSLAGQTIRLKLGVFNDGNNGSMAMWVDNVSVLVCPVAPTTTGTWTPTPTWTPIPFTTQVAPTATPTATRIATPTPAPTATRIATRIATPTPAPTATPTAMPRTTSTAMQAIGDGPTSVTIVRPAAGDSGSGLVAFEWQPNAPLLENQVYELVFWRKEESLEKGRALQTAGPETSVTVDVSALAPDTYQWGIWLGLRTTSDPSEYLRLRFFPESRRIFTVVKTLPLPTAAATAAVTITPVTVLQDESCEDTVGRISTIPTGVPGACDVVPMGSVCYLAGTVAAELTIQGERFDRPGDILPVSSVSSLRTGDDGVIVAMLNPKDPMKLFAVGSRLAPRPGVFLWKKEGAQVVCSQVQSGATMLQIPGEPSSMMTIDGIAVRFE